MHVLREIRRVPGRAQAATCVKLVPSGENSDRMLRSVSRNSTSRRRPRSISSSICSTGRPVKRVESSVTRRSSPLRSSVAIATAVYRGAVPATSWWTKVHHHLRRESRKIHASTSASPAGSAESRPSRRAIIDPSLIQEDTKHEKLCREDTALRRRARHLGGIDAPHCRPGRPAGGRHAGRHAQGRREDVEAERAGPQKEGHVQGLRGRALPGIALEGRGREPRVRPTQGHPHAFPARPDEGRSSSRPFRKASRRTRRTRPLRRPPSTRCSRSFPT